MILCGLSEDRQLDLLSSSRVGNSRALTVHLPRCVSKVLSSQVQHLLKMLAQLNGECCQNYVPLFAVVVRVHA